MLAQQPFELIDELLTYTAIQIDIEPDRISDYASSPYRVRSPNRHPSAPETSLLTPAPAPATETQLQTFLFNEACRLEQSTALVARAKQFLRSQGILQPTDSRLARLVGEQRKVAREQIFEPIAASLAPDLQSTLDALLVVEAPATTSALQRIKANPKNPPRMPLSRSS